MERNMVDVPDTGDAVSCRNRANVAKRKQKVTRKGGYWVHGKQAQKAQQVKR